MEESKGRSRGFATYSSVVGREHEPNAPRNGHVGLTRLDALHSHVGGYKARRAGRRDRGAGTVNVEEVRDAVRNHLLARPEEVIFWVLHEVPYQGIPVVAHGGANIACRLGAPN